MEGNVWLWETTFLRGTEAPHASTYGATPWLSLPTKAQTFSQQAASTHTPKRPLVV